MTHFLLPVALLSIVCLAAEDALARHPINRRADKIRGQAAALANPAQAPAAAGNAQNVAPVVPNPAPAMVGNGQNLAFPVVNPYLGYGYGPGVGFYPGYLPMSYPGVGYVSRVPMSFQPGTMPLPGNIYTQSYFNSPAYGHWNGFGKGK